LARAKPIAANAAIAASAKNNEQNIRRHRDGVNVRFGILSFIGLGFVEVWIVQLRDLLVSPVYTGNKRRGSEVLYVGKDDGIGKLESV